MVTTAETKYSHYMMCLKCTGKDEHGQFKAGTVEFPDDPKTLDKGIEVECQGCYTKFKVGDFYV